jgi:hypothetical protein
LRGLVVEQALEHKDMLGSQFKAGSTRVKCGGAQTLRSLMRKVVGDHRLSAALMTSDQELMKLLDFDMRG